MIQLRKNGEGWLLISSNDVRFKIGSFRNKEQYSEGKNELTRHLQHLRLTGTSGIGGNSHNFGGLPGHNTLIGDTDKEGQVFIRSAN